MISHKYNFATVAALMAMTVAIAPFAVDTYLPAFPEVAATLGVSINQVSLSISLYVFTLALGYLTGGSLSDRFGRQPIMLSGLGLYAVASLCTMQVDSLSELLLLRVLQALGSGWAAVCVPALVRDHFSGKEAARFFSLIGLFTISAPAIAPSLGSVLLHYFGWHSIFLFTGVYALFVLVLLRLLLFRSYQAPVASVQTSMLERYKQVFSVGKAMRFMLISSLAFAVIILFVTHSSFIYQQHFQVGPGTFALLFGANILVMMLLNLLNRHWLKTYLPEQILLWAVTAQGLAIAVLLLELPFDPGLFIFVPAMMLTIGTLGVISPNIQACYMEFFPQNGGTAAALLGATQFSVGGLIATASTMLPESLNTPIICMSGCALLGLLLTWIPSKDPTTESTGAA